MSAGPDQACPFPLLCLHSPRESISQGRDKHPAILAFRAITLSSLSSIRTRQFG